MEPTLDDLIGWATLTVWALWLLLYWGAGVGLVSNFFRSFRSSMFFYDRFFILGLVALSNVILWTGCLILLGRISNPLSDVLDFITFVGGVMLITGTAGTFWCRRQMRASWSAHTSLVPNHRLVDHGPYQVVRHPIYAFACLMVIGTVLIFPTWWNISAGAGMLTLYVVKSKVEENMLEQELNGYRQYKRRVRYRFLPFIW